jgi:3-oxoacyl-[acyl-carrier protein] reductase
LNLNLESKNFLITGSSRGIGKSIAQAFLDDGANVGLVSRSKSDLENCAKSLRNNESSSVSYWSYDLSIESEVLKLSKDVDLAWNQIDGLVLNVGDGSSLPNPITSSEQWNAVWKTNFDTALFTARAFLPSLKENCGSIVFISSICGIESLGAPTDYSVAKAALISFAKNLARKVAPEIRVNVVAPGNILFDGGTWDMKIKENKSWVDDMLEKEVPLRRFGKPEEIGDAVIFLCSNRTSFITGSTLIVDGGQTRSF